MNTYVVGLQPLKKKTISVCGSTLESKVYRLRILMSKDSPGTVRVKDDFKMREPFGLRGLYKNNSAL